MRLLLFINSLDTGGAERVISKLANHWAAAGHRVTLATLVPPGNDHYPLNPGVQRVSLHAGETSTSLLHTLTNNLRRAGRLRRLLRAEQPDCVVAFLLTANVLAYAAAFPGSTPVVMSERSHPPNFPLRFPWSWLRKLTYPRSAALVVLTDLSAQWCAVNLGCTNTHVVPNAVALPLGERPPRLSPADYIAADDLLVLSVGRLEAGKQMDQVVRGFAAGRARLQLNSKLVLIGQGPLLTSLQALVESLQLSQQVIFVPQVGNIQAWFERADIYVSASCLEGYPNVLLEAMACGCACIAYNCPTGPAEILQDTKNGYLVPLNEEPLLTRRLTELMQDRHTRAQLGSAARLVTRTHSQAQFLARWDAVVAGATR